MINNFMWFIPDSQYLKIIYYLRTGQKLNLREPKSFNEKLQWLKLHDHNLEYSKMVDKYEVRKYISDKIGEQYLIPLIGVWDKIEDVEFDKLPKQFVLKCTHDSGGILVCKDKDKLDIKETRKWFAKRLKRNFYYSKREWPYKNVKPRIIAEKYMVDESGTELKDYKIFNFHGVPKFIEVDYDRFVNHKRKIYTDQWELTDVRIIYSNEGKDIPRPDNLDEMLELARILSKDMIHLRTDFYSINGRVYFGELTFFHESGFGKFIPEKVGYEWGNYMNLKLLDRCRRS